MASAQVVGPNDRLVTQREYTRLRILTEIDPYAELSIATHSSQSTCDPEAGTRVVDRCVASGVA